MATQLAIHKTCEDRSKRSYNYSCIMNNPAETASPEFDRLRSHVLSPSPAPSFGHRYPPFA